MVKKSFISQKMAYFPSISVFLEVSDLHLALYKIYPRSVSLEMNPMLFFFFSTGGLILNGNYLCSKP